MNTGVADKVVDLRSKCPSMKTVEISRQVGVSRERVRQILKRNGLPTKIVLPRALCRSCSHPLHEKNRGGFCQRCLEALGATLICVRCGQQYQAAWPGSSHAKYCPDCRLAVARRQLRFCMYRRNWERQHKSRKYHCIFCQSRFDSVGELAKHRADSGELSNLDFRKWVTTYRLTHSYWQTLEYFHISQETFKAIRDGKESPNHH